MKYEIIRSTWHSPMSGHCIGVVAIKSHANIWKWKAYIGVGNGFDAKIDEQEVASNGAPIEKSVAQGYFPELNIEEYGN